MPVSRMKMRQWLEKMIDSNCVSGLEWVDKEKTMFSIPWMHAAHHGWELDKDAFLFKLWAIHTGKYIEGQTTADPKRWKANFRSAMNSLTDIEKMNDKSINKGHRAMRIYKILPLSKDIRSQAKDAKRRNKSKRVKSEDVAHDRDTQSLVDSCLQLSEASSTQETTIDSTECQVANMAEKEVCEWSPSVEIRPESTNHLFQAFEVSPEHSTENSNMDDDIIRIWQQMEEDLPLFQSSSDIRWLLNLEAHTDSYSHSSPGSQWSDTSSAGEGQDLFTETVLGQLQPITDNSLYHQTDHLL
ncbi:interferon regulatory factor 1-like isoform X2 [Myripristis murdjan]|uniref:interferon regulatory factor 1-like isoform X2 n=1 Tax=Myripristis murdjan TaxID=586833 RepID=UPI001175F069|nr:interferon regulatory factor 1-like isoform X2 [Myripristis murdjan]